MKHTADQIRRENGVLWKTIWRLVGLAPSPSFKSFRRPLIRELSKRSLMEAARGTGPTHWLIDAALLEAMRRAKGELQTDIEDWAPTTQQGDVADDART